MALNPSKVFKDDEDDGENRNDAQATIEVNIPNEDERLPSVVVNDGTEDRREASDDGDERQGADPYEAAIEGGERRQVGKTARQRARQRAARDRTQHEMEFLRSQVEHLSGIVGNFGQNQIAVAVSTVENRMVNAKGNFEAAETAIKRAAEGGDGDALVAAMRVRDAAATEYNQLAATKNNIIRQAQTQNGQQRQAPEGGDQRQVREQAPVPQHRDDPDANAMMEAFLERVPWFDPKGRAPEDRQVQALDDYVATLYEPGDPRYWQELEKRVRQELPERFDDERPARRQARNDAREDRNVRKFPNTGGRRESRVTRGPDGRTKYNLDREQTDALEQIGLLHVDKSDKQAMARRDKILASWFKNGEAA